LVRARNWTLIDLAQKIGIREGPLRRIEFGKNPPSAQVNSKNNPERQFFSLSFEIGTFLISNQARLQKTDLFENPDNKSKSEKTDKCQTGSTTICRHLF